MRRPARLVVGFCFLFPDLFLLILLAMIAVPPKPPAAFGSVAALFHHPDYNHLPPVLLYRARDGAQLAYRVYPGGSDRIAVLIHGLTGDSTSMHALAKALSSSGITVYALDMRGHGDSGNPGDISYLGQLDDDVADFLPVARSHRPRARLALVAFSAGAGFGLRFDAGPYGRDFDQYVLLSPELGYGAPVVRPAGHTIAEIDTPRVTGISMFDRIGIHWFDGLPAISFAAPPDLSKVQTRVYSIRLARNFGCDPDYRGDFRRASRPTTLLVGGGDELVYASEYPAFVAGIRPDIPVAVLGHYSHMDMISNPQAIREIQSRVAGLMKAPPPSPATPDSPADSAAGEPSRAALHSHLPLSR